MKSNDLLNLCIECYNDAVSVDLPHPIVVVTAVAGSVLGRAVAERHMTFLLHKARATIVNALGTTHLQPFASDDDEDIVQAWPLALLLDAMQETGCPPQILEKYRAILSKQTPQNCWMFGILRNDQVMLAPLKVA